MGYELMKYWPGFLLLLAGWLQPTHHLPWMSWHSEVLAFAALAWLVLASLWKMKRAGQVQLAVPRIVVLPIALGLYALIQLGLGQIQYFGDALVVALYMAACAMALTVGYQQGLKSGGAPQEAGLEAWLEQLAATVVVGACVSTAIMLVQAFQLLGTTDGIFQLQTYRRPGGNIGQTNHMATLLLIGMASLAYLFERRRFGSLVAGMIQLVLMLGLAVTESRTGLLGAAMLTAWLLVRRGLFPRMNPAYVMAAIWAHLLLLVWVWPFLITAIHHEHTGAGTRVGEGVGLRGVVWQQLLDAALQRPLMGWGLREISQAYNAVLHRYPEGAPFSYAHNILLDLAVGIGLPLTLVLVVVCVRWFWRRARSAHTLNSWYCMALAIPLGTHSMLEYPHAYAYFLIPVLVAIGALEAGFVPRAALKIRTGYAGLLALLVFLCLTWSAVEYVAIEEDFRVARFEALRIGQTSPAYKAPEVMLLTQLDAMLKASRITPGSEMSPDDIELLRQAANRFPWTAIQNRYALSLALNGNPEEAMRQMQVMRAMHGEKHYEGIKASWASQGEERYPQLKKLKLP